MGNEDEENQPRKVKFTDKRRVHADESDRAPASVESVTAEAAPSVEAGAAGSELEQAKQQAAEYLEHLQRLQAEFANYRKRVLKEQTRAVEMASESVVRRLLEVLDEFALALLAA